MRCGFNKRRVRPSHRKKPHVDINQRMEKLETLYLNVHEKDITQWKKNEKIGKKDFNAFMREVAKQKKYPQ